MELLSVLPRGTGPLGFYEDATQRVPIEAIRLAADVPEAERSKLQVLRTDTPLFDAVVESRRNRRDDWYKRPAGHIDLRSEEHTSELQSLMRISYAVFCLKKTHMYRTTQEHAPHALAS